MKPQQQPSKEQVRTWFHKTVAARRPPQSPEEIRRELGWNMLANNGPVPPTKR